MILARVLARTVAVLAAMTLPITGMACKEACNERGCDDRITFQVSGVTLALDQRFSVEACIDGACSEGVRVTWKDRIIGRDGAPDVDVVPDNSELLYEILTLPDGLNADQLEIGNVHRVSLRLDVEGQPLVEVEEEVTLGAYYPNGSGCPPACAAAEVTVKV